MTPRRGKEYHMAEDKMIRPSPKQGTVIRPLPEGTEQKGNQNPPNTSTYRPPKPGGSSPTSSTSGNKDK